MQIILFNRNIWRNSVRSLTNFTHKKNPEVYLPQKSNTDVQNAACYRVPVHSVLGELIQSGTHAQSIFRLQQDRRGALHKHFSAVFRNLLLHFVYLCMSLPEFNRQFLATPSIYRRFVKRFCLTRITFCSLSHSQASGGKNTYREERLKVNRFSVQVKATKEISKAVLVLPTCRILCFASGC